MHRFSESSLGTVSSVFVVVSVELWRRRGVAIINERIRIKRAVAVAADDDDDDDDELPSS